MSALLQIAQALLAALMAPVPLAGGRVWLNRTRPIPEADESAIVISIDTARASEQVLGGHALDMDSEIRVVCFVRAAPSGGEPAAAIDALMQAAWARVQTVQGFAMQRPPELLGIDYDFSDLNSSLVTAALRLRVQHRVLATTLAAWP